jgi:hypothetical protein
MTVTAARERTTSQDMRRRVLALVLFVVLVWYTVVSPSYAAAPLRAPDDDPADAEEREAQPSGARGFASPRRPPALAPNRGELDFDDGEGELDWPEIIGDG